MENPGGTRTVHQMSPSTRFTHLTLNAIPATLLSVTILLSLSSRDVSVEAEEKNDALKRNPADIEAIVRLQVFLDQAEFTPGRIDGSLGQFTFKALALYREAHGIPLSPPIKSDESNPDSLPDVSDIDLAATPTFTLYTVTESDLANIGELPDNVADQAKSEAMTYRSAAESVAEKFHTDVNFLEELNPGKTGDIQAGDTLSVPNVKPFELSAVTKGSVESTESNTNTTFVRINTGTSMLTVYEGEKLIAAYPVTIGSGQTESPVGDWKVTEISGMPNFRYDKSMLKEGIRSDNFHMLPPGPNNPVGVLWIQLNKSGIGMHGTSEPETIGRSSSHGCVRLANWDVVRLAARITAGVPVEIH